MRAVPATASATLSTLALSACYASHERGEERDAAIDAPGLDAPSVDARATDAARRPCTWELVDPWPLTDGPGDQGLNDAIAIEGSFLVVTGSMNDPPPEPGRFVHRVSLEAPIGERQELFGAPAGAFFSNVALAANDAGLAAFTWDDAGCAMRGLSREGDVVGARVTLPIARCVGPIGTGDGFVLFDRPSEVAPSLHLLSADATRVLASSAPIAVLEDAFWWSRARLDDGSFVVASMHTGVSPTSASVQHLDARGAPLAEPVPLPDFEAASRVRLTTTRDGLLAAWLVQPEGDAESQERSLRVVPLDAEGRAVGLVQRPSRGIAYRDGGLSSAPLDDGGALFAFVEIDAGDRFGERTRVTVVRVDASGGRIEERTLRSGTFQRSPVVRVRGDEALVGFTANPAAGATQVFLGGLVCRSRG
jgi:hypothetical protein